MKKKQLFAGALAAAMMTASLADGTCTPEQFAQWMSDKAAEASAE